MENIFIYDFAESVLDWMEAEGFSQQEIDSTADELDGFSYREESDYSPDC